MRATALSLPLALPLALLLVACGEEKSDCDDGATPTTWFLDADGDGFAGSETTQEACASPGAAWLPEAEDCDDADAAVSPAGAEVCDGVDNDCDGVADGDDAVDPGTWYADADGDGHGDPDTAVLACDAPADHVAGDGDCDDADASVSPDADEVCDGIDNDCDGDADEDDALDAMTWFADADGDGFGDAASTAPACVAPSGFVGDDSDCDDTDGAVHPDAEEVCDGADNDCDGSIDGDLGVPLHHASIGEALDAATDGDTICLAGGTWPELVDFGGKSVHIEGYEGAALTTLDGMGDGPVVTVAGGEAAVLSGVTITGGTAPQGAAVHVDGSGLDLVDVVVEDNHCTEADADCEGVVYATGATLSFEQVELSGNTVAPAPVEGAVVAHGVLQVVDSELAWTGGVIEGNTVEGASDAAGGYVRGAALHFDGATVSMDDVDILDNTASSVAATSGVVLGVVALDASDWTFRNGTVSGNRAAANARVYGLVWSSASVVTWEGVGFEDNTAETTDGASCWAESLFYNQWGELHGSDVLWSGNTLRTDCSGTASTGFAIDNDSGTVVLDTSVWSGDTLEAVSATGAAAVGGLFYGWMGALELDRVQVADHWLEATTGGTGRMNYAAVPGLFQVRRSSVDWTNVIVSGNHREATAGGSSYADYGVLRVLEASAALTNVDIVGNAAVAGRVRTGVFFDEGYGSLELVNTVVSGNALTADNGHANVYYSYQAADSTAVSTLSVRYCDVFDNTGHEADFMWSGGTTVDITGADGNLAVDPGYADTTATDSVDWDLSLGAGSSLVDAGDPAILDADGSVSDMGAHGGAYGAW